MGRHAHCTNYVDSAYSKIGMHWAKIWLIPLTALMKRKARAGLGQEPKGEIPIKVTGDKQIIP